MKKKAKQLLFIFPEYYLLVLALLAAYTPPFSFNLFFVGFAIIPLLQIIVKNNRLGIVIGSLFLLVNLYMLGALISEFNEFATFNSNAKQLLFVGLFLWVLNITAAILMVYKYLRVITAKNLTQQS